MPSNGTFGEFMQVCRLYLVVPAGYSKPNKSISHITATIGLWQLKGQQVEAALIKENPPNPWYFACICHNLEGYTVIFPLYIHSMRSLYSKQ